MEGNNGESSMEMSESTQASKEGPLFDFSMLVTNWVVGGDGNGGRISDGLEATHIETRWLFFGVPNFNFHP